MSSSKLREALRDKIEETRGYIGHPDYASEIEQNAAQTVLRVLEELDQVVEYEETPRCVIIGGGHPLTFAELPRGAMLIVSPSEEPDLEDVLQVLSGKAQRHEALSGRIIERLKCEEFEKYENEERYYSREGWTKIDKKYGKRETNRAQALGGGKKAGRVGFKIPARPRGRIAR